MIASAIMFTSCVEHEHGIAVRDRVTEKDR
jgi:hypothetical protein